MELSIQLQEQDRLRELTFTEVFLAFAEQAHRHWEQRRMEYHIVSRARRCCRKRRMQPGYAALFQRDPRSDSASEPDTAW